MKAIYVKHDRQLRAFWVGVLSCGLLLWSGCTDGPSRALAGARSYSAGTRSLAAGDAQTAIAELSRAADLVPHASEIRNHLGLAYWRLGDLDEAESAFDQALELDCENQAARFNRDRLLAERSEGLEAPRRDEHGR